MSSAPQGLPNIITDAATGQRINLLDWQAANVRYSWALALVVAALLAGVAYLLALAFDPGAALFFVAVAVLLAGGQSLAAYWFSDQLALRVSGAREATREEHRYLVNVTEAVSIGAGIPVPKMYVIDSSAPNAFATGRNPEHGAVAVTTGLIELLDRQELEGVVAHELAHIKNYDILFASMLAATVGAVVVLRDLLLRSRRGYGWGRGYGRRGRGGYTGGYTGGGGGRGGAQALALALLAILLVLAPILATLLRFAVSRRREFLADATSAYITRNPEGLARALEKLRDYKGEPLAVSEGVQHMFFTNPAKHLNARALFATHPPLAERIQRLRQV